jgi:DNA-binding GntR family transcriptional regulator
MYGSEMTDRRSGGDDKRSTARRVADELKAQVGQGAYQVGEALPPLREIATRYGVAVNTALGAARLLCDEGYVTSKPNSGYIVRDRTATVDPERELRALRAQLADMRTQVRQTMDDLSKIEDRISDITGTVSRLEDHNREAGQSSS